MSFVIVLLAIPVIALLVFVLIYNALVQARTTATKPGRTSTRN